MNDWDLSHRTGESHDGGERTGTLPFMAMDLLDEDAIAGRKRRLYRHDLEGLIWILPWVFLQYENGKLAHDALSTWCTGDHAACLAHKTHFLRSIGSTRPLPSWNTEWNMAFAAILWIRERRSAQEDLDVAYIWSNRSKPLPEPLPELPKDMYHSFLRQLSIVWEKYPRLEELMRELEMVPDELTNP